jgi:hypothetical protein
MIFPTLSQLDKLVLEQPVTESALFGPLGSDSTDRAAAKGQRRPTTLTSPRAAGSIPSTSRSRAPHPQHDEQIGS